jgi:hypothetical protein
MAKDFLGNVLKINDKVAFVQLGYRNLKQGIVFKITDKMVFIKHEKFNVGGTETKQYLCQVIKIKEGGKDNG